MRALAVVDGEGVHRHAREALARRAVEDLDLATLELRGGLSPCRHPDGMVFTPAGPGP